MNNVSSINKAKRLTEEEVHKAADELKESGIKVSSIEVYKFLGRGSLTTITNFLKAWNQEETQAATLPALIMLPETLIKSTEQLIIKVWAESQALAEKEINSQREALRQAEAAANEKITEAEAFSEEQTKQIEKLETNIEDLKKEKSDDNMFFLGEKKRLQKEIENTKKDEAIFEQRFIETEKQLNKAISESTEQQKKNISITTENVQLKTKLEAAEQKLMELEKQIKNKEEKNLKLEAESKKIEVINEVQRNQINQLAPDLENQKELVLSREDENKLLREKAAKLEGELIAWKTIKPKNNKINQPLV